MKYQLRIPVFLAAAAFATGPLAATDDFAAGDLSLVFYSLTGTPPVIGTEYYVFNLGAAASFRENTQNNVPVKTVNNSISDSNIATDLASVFGPSWADGGNVQMMVVATIRQDGTLTSGDPTRTIYFSGARSSLNAGQTGPDALTPFIYYQGNPANDTLPSGVRIQSSNQISAFLYTATNGTIANGNPQSGANVSGVRLTTSADPDLSNYIPPTTGSTYFALGLSPNATLGVGALPGTANIEAAVDVFRVLHTSTNADLTSGSSSGNAVLGQGQFIGSITLDSAGNLKVQAVGVPTTGNYTSWAATNNVTGGPNGDSDNDGIINLVEYALALNPAASDGAPGTFSGGTLTFNKRPVAVSNNDVTYLIEESDDLGISDPWQPVTPASNTPTEITYTLPTGAPKKFSRLKVVQAAP